MHNPVPSATLPSGVTAPENTNVDATYLTCDIGLQVLNRSSNENTPWVNVGYDEHVSSQEGAQVGLPQQEQKWPRVHPNPAHSRSTMSSDTLIPMPASTPLNFRRPSQVDGRGVLRTPTAQFLRSLQFHVWPLHSTLSFAALAAFWSFWCLLVSWLGYGISGASDYVMVPFTRVLSTTLLGAVAIGSTAGLVMYCITWPKVEIHTRKRAGELEGILLVVYRASTILIFLTGLCALPLGVTILRVPIHGGHDIRRAFDFSIVGASCGMIPIAPLVWCFSDIQDFFLQLLHYSITCPSIPLSRRVVSTTLPSDIQYLSRSLLGIED
ncbi:hypothetical protein CERSUDRAFT_119732 [Gelatoporia subvermispora B]|uniref:Uncharacterized protein n=1 Tax=Ceriporiopsis subvermispora (strain B) TaxID=914234 RepID=M2QYB5_CERS8|nr:hypothetical protein CERSUDRAFT_119732 [Gelatoporia subvermispora B]